MNERGVFMEAFVARQPIFDRGRKIYGYELLFRDGTSNAFPSINGETATSKVISNSFLDIGIDRISGSRKAFINFTEKLLARKVPTMFPREKIVVEILEEVDPDEEVLNACREMAQNGYQIALDDFSHPSNLEPFLSIAKIIKIDLRLTPFDEAKELMDKLASYGVKFLAEKVETYEEFQQSYEMGFEYFQGFFFSKPKILTAKAIAPSKITLLQITALANKPDFKFGELEELIQRDVTISYKLLRYINSSYFRRVQEISSIKQAIVLLGEKGVRRFVSLVAMAQLAFGKPTELIRTSIIRARFCELLAKGSIYKDESELFTVGLFSLIDAVLDDTMENVMERLPLSERIKSALIQREGKLGEYLNLVSFYEEGDWSRVSEVVEKIGVDEKEVPGYYLDAVGWGDSFKPD